MNRFAQISCGRALAPDSGVSVNIFSGYENAFASKPAPTLTVFTARQSVHLTSGGVVNV